MGCSGCSTGRGCGSISNTIPAGCRSNGSCASGGCNKLHVFDWLSNMELSPGETRYDIVEVRFKNSRKDFFRVPPGLELYTGDVVAVEASPGHDIGIVSVSGELVHLQLRKKNVLPSSPEIKKIYRKARQNDILRWEEAQKLESDTMHRAREIAGKLGLEMKISDVEFQGDKTKATFYYTAEGRVDFRELIKRYAEQFKVRIEMRQIGARQEAGRLGGIGSCGRELCCATWLTDFRSVATSAARYQQLALNPLKLAGQCGKLKCCLNYELDSYLDAIKDFPNTDVKLETARGMAFHQKTDIFRGTLWYSYADAPEHFIELSSERVLEIQKLNKTGSKPEELLTEQTRTRVKEKVPDFENVVGQDSISRFDDQRKRSRKKKRRKPDGDKPAANPGVTRPAPRNRDNRRGKR